MRKVVENMWGLVYFIVAGAAGWFLAARALREVFRIDTMGDEEFERLYAHASHPSRLVSFIAGGMPARRVTGILRVLTWILLAAFLGQVVFAVVRGLVTGDIGTFVAWILILTCIAIPAGIYAASVVERIDRIDRRAESSFPVHDSTGH